MSHLLFRYFDSDTTDNKVDGYIHEGGYVLHQYSQANFLYHIRGAWRDVGGANQILRSSIGKFLKVRWNPSFDSEPQPSFSILERIQSMGPEDYKKLGIVAAHLRICNLVERINGLWIRVIDTKSILTSSCEQTSRCF